MNTVEAIKDKRKIEDMKKVLKAHNHRDYLLFVLGINTGLRISDLLQLTLGDVLDQKNRPAQQIVIKEQKTGKERKIILNDVVRKALQEAIASKKDVQLGDYLFKSQKGDNRPISRVQAWQVLNNAARAVGIEGRIGTHTLRKTFGYHAYQQGIDITLLQQLFGHSAPSITLRYIGITQDDIDQVYVSMCL
ncbi:MAG: site-specific integrase [Syntrophomonadaceae bacterium]|nr:site-specific integrase [Syntrophomonadaceae bacterium]